ncbi:hypothetical protein J8J27_20820, partial [Mycobacterium tuberculosis]|nr:hypothetical protein [Mycobacterium tuberculosis]
MAADKALALRDTAAAAMAALRPDLGLVDRAEAIGELVRAAAALRHAEGERPALLADLDRREAELAELAVRLGLVFAAIRPALERLTATVAQRAEAAAEETAIAEAARRLDPSVADLGRLAVAALPGRDRIDGAERRLADRTDACRDAARALADAEAAVATAEDRLAALGGGDDLPTPERIAAARAERDALWRRLQPAVTGAEPAGPLHAAAVAAFETALASADGLADAALAAADRLAEHRRATADLAAAAARLADAAAASEAAAAAQRSELEAWRALWRSSDLAPA